MRKSFIFIFCLLLSFQLFAGCLVDLSLFRHSVRPSLKVDHHIQIERFFERIDEFRKRYRNDVYVKEVGRYDGYPIHRIDIPGRGKGPRQKIIITAGVHGNEAAGTATAMQLIEQIVHDQFYRSRFDFVIFPGLNPGGLAHNDRQLNNGKDFNRTMQPGKAPRSSKILRRSLKGEKFDYGFDLHEAFAKDGFFAIKGRDNDGGLARKVLDEFNQADLERAPNGQYPYALRSSSNPAKIAYNFSGPGEAVSTNKGTVKYFMMNELGAKDSYTLEAPGQMPLARRIELYLFMVKSFLRNI